MPFRSRFIAGVALLTLGAATAVAVDPITVDPRNATACYIAGRAWAGNAATPVINADGAISYYYNASWVEIPFTVVTPGIYDASFTVYTPVADLTAQIDVRPKSSNVHYITPDFAIPNTGDWGTPGDVAVTGIPLLQAGDYLLRVYNTKLIHNNTAADRAPGYDADSGFNWSIITLTNTGDLPPMGTVSGAVKSADMGAVPVADAFVMANTGTPAPEPGPFWQKGYWTTTAADGSFTLPAPAGANNVQAGQPSMYAISGSPVAQATVAAGQTSAVDLNLPSRFTKDQDGKYTVKVESEYFTGKDPDAFSTSPGAYASSPVVIQGQAPASNGFFCGYMDVGNYVDVPVDIPAGQGGEYTVTDLYFNGYWDGSSFKDAITKITANLGTADENSVEATEPNSAPSGSANPSDGYTTQGSTTFAAPIVLKAGHNLVRLTNMGDGAVNAAAAWDAFVLVQKNVPVTATARQALRIAAGLDAGPSPAAGAAFTALNLNTSGASAGVIDITDAIALAKAGKL
ncbi:MAG TPA: hypothetical protein VGM37_21410 [Armatimonadota bacterium]